MPYIGSTPTKVVSRQSATVYRYTATAGQTVFSGADLDNAVLACNPADMIVHMNGIRLESTDYTATSTTVTLTTAATAGDEITVTSFETFEVADTYTKTAADDRYVNTTGDTISGNLIVDGSVALNSGDGVTVSRGSSHVNTYEGGRVTLKNGSGFTKQYGLDTYYENFRIYRENTDATGGVVRFEIDAEGRVRMQNQPSFIAHKSHNNNVSGVVTWTTLHQTGNHFNGTRFTAPVTGRYHFDFGGITHDVTNYFYLGLKINGSNSYGDQAMATWRHLPQTNAAYDFMHTSAVLHLNANDYVEAAVGYNGGSPRLEQYRTSFSGYLIG